MEKKTVETQELILETAKRIFAQKGFAGARMQEIADEAGINKALLHYYYRSKEKLFEQVFNDAFERIVRPLVAFLADDSELFSKIRNICTLYHKVLLEYPFIPNFVINEINIDPDRLIKLFETEGIVLGMEKFINQIEEAIAEGKIRLISPRELLLNILSMCIFPFASKPLTDQVLFPEEDINAILEQRANNVADFVIQSIRVKD